MVTLLTVHEYDFLTSLGWDPVRRSGIGWPSILALADTGWVLTATLASCGVLGVAFAVGLYRSTRSVAAALLVGLLSAAVGLEAFTTDPPTSLAPSTWHGDIHKAVYPLLVVLAVAAPAAVGRALWAELRWRGYGAYSFMTTALLAATLTLQAPARFGQVLEYLFFGALLLWLEVVALRLWFLSTDARS